MRHEFVAEYPPTPRSIRAENGEATIIAVGITRQDRDIFTAVDMRRGSYALVRPNLEAASLKSSN
ncbi:MAG: hypothetical protein AUF79_15475 [Crenarchaeota archaeon 13_1_20CM_2_51_8]|nr:MAG: hypothetical protein AUF79_15475 [Crenarchaeota archaeon 13_1_20CM_2_51_8]